MHAFSWKQRRTEKGNPRAAPPARGAARRGVAGNNVPVWAFLRSGIGKSGGIGDDAPATADEERKGGGARREGRKGRMDWMGARERGGAAGSGQRGSIIRPIIGHSTAVHVRGPALPARSATRRAARAGGTLARPPGARPRAHARARGGHRGGGGAGRLWWAVGARARPRSVLIPPLLLMWSE